MAATSFQSNSGLSQGLQAKGVVGYRSRRPTARGKPPRSCQLAGSKAATMAEVAHQLLITLVHGTWPRGFFPRIFLFKQRVRELTGRRRPWDPPPFWFEDGSSFRARLSDELRDIPHKIMSPPWTGANSIYERDQAAHDLAKHVSAEHAEYPHATQLIIAHSHGGNIALRALRDLQKGHDSHSCGAEGANPLVVTLATPFVEVQHADFGARPRLIRFAVLCAIALSSWTFAKAIFPGFLPSVIVMAVSFFPLLFISTHWVSEGGDARRHKKVEALADATRLGEIASAQAQPLFR
jgi:hypothetical protein